MTIHEAIRSLRGDRSQQAFATELGLSISTIQKLEKDRVPEPRSLYALVVQANQAGRKDLAEIFAKAFNEEIGGNLLSVNEVEDARRIPSSRR